MAITHLVRPMGDYFVKLKIPANTPVDKPVTAEVTLKGEVLAELAYLIPPGWSALAHFAVFYGIKQIYPAELGTWVTGDDLYRLVALRWHLPESPAKLTIKGYNQDDTYPHTVYLWLHTKPLEEAKPWQIIADFVKILKKLMGLS